MSSLRRVLSISLGVGLLLSLLVQGSLGFFGLRWTAEEQVRSRLEYDAETLLAALEISPEGIPWLDRNRLNPVFARPFSGHYYLIKVAGLKFYSRSFWQDDFAEPEVGEQPHFSKQPGPRDQSLIVFSRRFTEHNNLPIEIFVAEDLTPLNQQVNRLSLVYVGVALLLALLLLGLQILSLRRTLRPLRELMTDLQLLSRGERSQLNDKVPAELVPLVQAFNQLITTLNQRHERTRNAMSNLAHAFKKPLTLMRQQVSSLEPGRREPLEQQLNRLNQLMEHELSRARLSGPASGLTPIDLASELPVLIQLLERMHGEKTIQCEMRLPPKIPLAMERQDALELLGNLLDNAFKWARGRVRLSWSPEKGLLIEDDGPGCSPEDLASLSERGVRLDEQMPGHGFGLAIAREIVESYQGRLQLGSSQDLGGLAVCIAPGPDSKKT